MKPIFKSNCTISNEGVNCRQASQVFRSIRDHLTIRFFSINDEFLETLLELFRLGGKFSEDITSPYVADKHGIITTNTKHPGQCFFPLRKNMRQRFS